MYFNKENCEQAWISLILRVAVSALFAVAALGKFMGFEQYVASVNGMFAGTPLPGWLLKPYIYILPFAEALIPIWLIAGLKLKEGWIFTAFVLISLGFGLTVARQSAADVYMFMLIACVGLYMSKYDGCRVGSTKK